MRTELVSRSVVAFPWLLTSVCLRYGVAKPSVWLRKRICKLRRFNDFRSDYPLNLSSFWAQYWDVLEKLYMRLCFVLPSESFSSRTVSRSRLQRLAGIVVCASNDLACRSLIGEPVARLFASEYAGQLPLVPCLDPLAARNCCLNVHRKSCLKPSTLASLNSCPTRSSREEHLFACPGTPLRQAATPPLSFVTWNNHWRTRQRTKRTFAIDGS